MHMNFSYSCLIDILSTGFIENLVLLFVLMYLQSVLREEWKGEIYVKLWYIHSSTPKKGGWI